MQISPPSVPRLTSTDPPPCSLGLWAPPQNASARVPSGSRVANITQFAPPGHTHAPYLAGSEHAKLGVCCSGRAPGAPRQRWQGC